MLFFFFNDTATTEIYTLSLHDALPICYHESLVQPAMAAGADSVLVLGGGDGLALREVLRSDVRRVVEVELRSEEHTSELQSRQYLVCRLLLEKKKNNNQRISQ